METEFSQNKQQLKEAELRDFIFALTVYSILYSRGVGTQSSGISVLPGQVETQVNKLPSQEGQKPSWIASLEDWVSTSSVSRGWAR